MSALRSESDVLRIQEALRDGGLDGWLLYEFHGLNPVAAALLGVRKTTRRGFAFVPAEGEPTALIHVIEASAWRDWPHAVRRYRGWRELEDGLLGLLRGRRRIAMEVSPGGSVPTLDLVPAGLVGALLARGLEIASSADLVTRFHSVWSAEQREDHRRAAGIVADLARRAFERAADGVRRGHPLTEGELADWIRRELRAARLVHESDCIVAVGERASDPHYVPAGAGSTIERGRLLLVDLWGGFERSVPADQTWMGMLGSALDERSAGLWNAVRDARDAALDFLRARHADGAEVRGYEVDQAARERLSAHGLGEYFAHRTGHSIDVALHGSGPNLDDLETRDDRLLVEGVGFSVEPGVYIAGEIGLRSEVNVYWGAEGPEVTPAEPQRDVFLLLED